MSRIVLSRYPSGQERLVVGWDHPCNGAFWQEFNINPGDGIYPDGWEEVLRERGFFRGIPLEQFRDTLPEDLEPLVTDEVMRLLAEHEADPDSGYHRPAIDLS
jgi:hypothetical protein